MVCYKGSIVISFTSADLLLGLMIGCWLVISRRDRPHKEWTRDRMRSIVLKEVTLKEMVICTCWHLFVNRSIVLNGIIDNLTWCTVSLANGHDKTKRGMGIQSVALWKQLLMDWKQDLRSCLHLVSVARIPLFDKFKDGIFTVYQVL